MEIRRICKANFVNSTLKTAFFSSEYSNICLILVKSGNKPLDISMQYGIIKLTENAVLKEVSMAKPLDFKEQCLKDSGALNNHSVTDELFNDSEFFDPRDLVQVKYEMLRKVHKEGESVSHAASSFGFSRPSFYKILADFEREGIPGLLPRKRGPGGGHKLTKEVLEFIKKRSTERQPIAIPRLLEEVEKHFGIRVHRRSLERALKRYEKKTAQKLEKKNQEE